MHDTLFEGPLENFCYIFIRENNMLFEFIVADFPLMNLNDHIIVTKILSYVDVTKIIETNNDPFIVSFAHIKTFLDSYYKYLAITYIDLALFINKTLKVP